MYGRGVIEIVVAILVATLGTLGLFAWMDLRSRRERRASLEATAPFADAIAAALALPGKSPCDAPFARGAWSLVSTRSPRFELIVGAGWVRLWIPLEAETGGSSWDLARAAEFGRGGLHNDPAAPFRPLADDALGPGWWARGEHVEARVRALPAPLKELLQAPDGQASGVRGGRLGVSRSSSDAGEVARWARRVVESSASRG